MKRINRRGFTLIEVIVVAAIIAILAGILVPMIFSQIDESKTVRATGDAKSIMTSIITFKKDTGKWPILNSFNNCNEDIDFLADIGNFPTAYAGGWDQSSTSLMSDHLNKVNACYPAPSWKGPYIAGISADPWGTSYVVNIGSLGIAGRSVWVLSAGPNGRVETASTDTSLQGDDVGVRLK